MQDRELSALFAHNLTRIMDEKGLRQADIAKGLGVGRATVSDWCAGANVPRTPMFSALVNLLNVKPSDFFFEKEPTPVSEGERNTLDDQIMALVRQLTPENKKKFAAKLEVLLEFQEPPHEHKD